MVRNLFLFCALYVFIHFSSSFCTAHCALDLARDHALYNGPLLKVKVYIVVHY